MRVAFSSTGNSVGSMLSPVFGRCPYFVIADIGKRGKLSNVEVVPNSAMMQAGGAGIAAAQLVINKGAKAVVSGAIGPRAFAVLQQFGVAMYQGNTTKSIEENAKDLAEGKLSEIAVPGRMGLGGYGLGRGLGMARGGSGGLGMGRGQGRGYGAGRGRRWQ